jgi:hypothetical protein
MKAVAAGGNIENQLDRFEELAYFSIRASKKTASERGTVPFYCEDSAKSGQSPAVLFDAFSCT